MFSIFGKNEAKTALKSIAPAVELLKSAKNVASLLGSNVTADIVACAAHNTVPYCEDYIYINLIYNNVQEICTLDKGCGAIALLVKMSGVNGEARDMIENTSKLLFLTPLNRVASVFRPLVDAQDEKDDHLAVYRLLMHYQRVKETNQVGLWGLKVAIPAGAYDVKTADGRKGISMKKLDEFVSAINRELQ